MRIQPRWESWENIYIQNLSDKEKFVTCNKEKELEGPPKT